MLKDKKMVIRNIVTAVMLTAFMSLGAFLLVRNLGEVIQIVTGETSTISKVFEQLTQATVRPPVLFPFAVLFVIFFFSSQLKWNKWVMCALQLVLLIVLFLLVLYFTQVNGIRFGRVVTSLLRYISNGLLEQL